MQWNHVQQSFYVPFPLFPESTQVGTPTSGEYQPFHISSHSNLYQWRSEYDIADRKVPKNNLSPHKNQTIESSSLLQNEHLVATTPKNTAKETKSPESECPLCSRPFFGLSEAEISEHLGHCFQEFWAD